MWTGRDSVAAKMADTDTDIFEVRFLRVNGEVAEWEEWPRAKLLELRDQYDRDQTWLAPDVRHVQWRLPGQTRGWGFGPGNETLARRRN